MITLQRTVDYIVNETIQLKNKYTDEISAPIDWVAVFAQNGQEYESFLKETRSMGKIVKDTSTGPIFKLDSPIKTKAGELFIIKIRKPDKTRPQRGDADFRIDNYKEFKEKYFSDKHFSLIERKDYQMLELKDSDFDVLVYFSNPPISKVLGLS
ncbi:hypothetical protein IID23_05100 [Patescibacteria group bacterium]|nr:hypothetical protein [Patescibacteria group bacterium]